MLVLTLTGLLVARRIPFDDPEILHYVRIAYVVTQIIVLAIYYFVSSAVSSSVSKKLGSDSTTQVKAKNDQTVLKYGWSLPHFSFVSFVDDRVSQLSLLHPWFAVLFCRLNLSF